MARDSIVNTPQQLLEDTLVACDEFLTWTGAANATAARARVYHEALPRPASGVEYTLAELQAYRPFAIIYTADLGGWQARRVATESFGVTGRVLLYLEQDTPSGLANDLDALDEAFKESIGHILAASDAKPAISGLLDLAHQPGYLAIDQVILNGPGRSHPEDHQAIGDIVFASLEITYGIGVA